MTIRSSNFSPIYNTNADTNNLIVEVVAGSSSESSLITTNTSIEYGAGATTAKTQRVAISTDSTVIGTVTETSPASDTASSGLNGRLQRIAQRLTSLINLLPASLGTKTQALALSTVVSQDELTWTQMTAPSSTTAFATAGYKRITVVFNVLTINTNVVLRLEGSMDGTIWFNLSSANTDTTVTANGANAFNVESAIDFVRLTFVSESGGTAATIDATVRVSA